MMLCLGRSAMVGPALLGDAVSALRSRYGSTQATSWLLSKCLDASKAQRVACNQWNRSEARLQSVCPHNKLMYNNLMYENVHLYIKPSKTL